MVLVLDDEGACVRLGRQDRGAPWGSRRRSAALFAALECDGHFPDFHDFQAAFGDEVTVYTGSREVEDWEGVAWSGEALMLHTRDLEEHRTRAGLRHLSRRRRARREIGM